MPLKTYVCKKTHKVMVRISPDTYSESHPPPTKFSKKIIPPTLKRKKTKTTPLKGPSGERPLRRPLPKKELPEVTFSERFAEILPELRSCTWIIRENSEFDDDYVSVIPIGKRNSGK